jgi:hypothetical protein
MSGALILPNGVTPRAVEITTPRLHRLLVSAESTDARQSHGFVFQSGATRLLRLMAPLDYTAEVDAYSIDEDDVALRHSFKNMKAGTSVELGDLGRNANTKRDYIMYVSFWEGFGTNLQDVYVLRVAAEYWRSLFPADITPFLANAAFLGITNARADDAKWDKRREELKQLWELEKPPGSPMTVNFKRDHKKQRRVQCGISAAGFPALFQRLFDEEHTTRLERALDGKPLNP